MGQVIDLARQLRCDLFAATRSGKALLDRKFTERAKRASSGSLWIHALQP
ncbi:hypothetical protein DR64_821 [Paraburkholderia xenovorans LB400]|nr:hypothetical protein DR64_821 [Paraburkholderia xenovorans LB400]